MSAEALCKIDHDQKDTGSLGGVERLLRRARQLHVSGVFWQKVQEFLRSEQAYTLHKPTRRRLIMNHTYVAGIDAQWQAYLTDMQGIARQNDEMRYLVIVIDVFSKFAWAVPVHSKDAKAITAASAKCWQLQTHATRNAYKPTKARSSLTRTLRPSWSTTVSSTSPVNTSKRRLWYSD